MSRLREVFDSLPRRLQCKSGMTPVGSDDTQPFAHLCLNGHVALIGRHG